MPITLSIAYYELSAVRGHTVCACAAGFLHVRQRPLGSVLGLENYIQVIGNEEFVLAFGNSMKFLLVGVSLVIFLEYVISIEDSIK